MMDLIVILMYLTGSALLVIAQAMFWRADRRHAVLRARRSARTLRMQARLLVAQDRYYSGRQADALNGFGRALAREGWESP
jgi:hypothetical protein